MLGFRILGHIFILGEIFTALQIFGLCNNNPLYGISERKGLITKEDILLQ